MPNPTSQHLKTSLTNGLKPLVRPIYSKLVLAPTCQLLLNRTTVEKAYRDKPKYQLFPAETIDTPEVEAFPPFDQSFRYLQDLTYSTPDIFTTVVEDVLLEPGSGVVFTQSRQILAESLYPRMDLMTIAGAFLNKGFLKRKFFAQPAQTIPGYSSIYQGLPFGYYHRLVDSVPRCYLLNQPEYAEFPDIQVLHGHPLSETEKVLIPHLLPTNATLVRIQQGQLYHLEKLILPTYLTKFGSGYLPTPYIERLRKTVLPQRPSRRNKRIYISRAKSAEGTMKRHILNEAELFQELQKFGFERYQLEDYSLEEKIELFYDAEALVGAYGGGLTHMLFSENLKVLELQIMNKMQTYYYYLSKSLGHTYHCIFANKSNTRENFTVNIDEVVQILKGW